MPIRKPPINDKIPIINDDQVTAAALVDSADAVATVGWHRRILSHIPPGQFLRYVCVGVFNTVFGYTTFAVINYVLHRHRIPASYMYASALSNFVNITVAYLGYKFFVFRTKGNYLSEWIKAMAVYWSGFLPAMILLPLLVRLFVFLLPHQLSLHQQTLSGRDAAPYIANAGLMAFGVIYSFFGHKKVTFREAKS